MQIFEFYFNPKARGDRFFEIFSLEPAPSFDGAPSRMTGRTSKGNVYLVGELANALPQNSGLLQKLGKIVSQEYFSYPTPQSQETFFRALLKRANEFLAAELRQENVDWLLNLHVALLLIKNSERKSFFAIAKSGTIQVFMTRGTNVVDLGKNIEDSSSQGREVFGSIVSGFAFPQDKLLILTKDVYEALLKDQALSDLSVLSKEQHFKEFFQKKNKIFSRVSGILFALLAEEFVPQVPKLSFLRKHILSLRLPKLQLTFSQFLRFPISNLIRLRKLNRMKVRTDAFKQRVMLVGVLVVVLLGGFLLFQGERKEVFRQAQTIVLQIQVIQKEAHDALELSDQRSANILLQEAWKKASSNTGREVPFRETFVALQKELEQQLLVINNIQSIEEPSVLVDMGSALVDLIPQEMILVGENLYFFNPFSSKIFIFNIKEKKGEIISALTTIRYGIPLARSPLFFGEPNLLFSLTHGELEEFKLRDASSFVGMAGFEKNLYFLNSQQGTIVKYEDPLSNASAPSVWMSEGSLKKPTEAKSMAIDGNIWILTHDNTLQRYSGGFWQEDIQPLIFPLFKGATFVKTFPGLPYLYILDPSESRLILLTKSGDLVKQYRMKSREPLLDFTVSSSGNTLYLLSDSRVFLVDI